MVLDDIHLRLPFVPLPCIPSTGGTPCPHMGVHSACLTSNALPTWACTFRMPSYRPGESPRKVLREKDGTADPGLPLGCAKRLRTSKCSLETLARKACGFEKKSLEFEVVDASKCHFLPDSAFKKEQVQTQSYPWESNGERCAIICSVRFENFLAEKKPGERPVNDASSAIFIGEFGRAYSFLGEYFYYPNAFKKSICHIKRWSGRWCKGQCGWGKPTDRSCWAYSFRWHLEGGGKLNKKPVVMLQIIDKGGALGEGQMEEVAMAEDFGIPIYRVMKCIQDGQDGFLIWKAEPANWQLPQSPDYFKFGLGICAANFFFRQGWFRTMQFIGLKTIASKEMKKVIEILSQDHKSKPEGQVHTMETYNLFQDENGQTPAHLAAAGGYVEVLHALHKLGVDLSVQDGDGMTPAHLAAAEGHVQVLHSLHKLGVDLSVQDGDGTTPAHLAAHRGHVQVQMAGLQLTWLQQKVVSKWQDSSSLTLGVDLLVRDKHGLTPAHIAASVGQVQVLHSLHKLGVDLSVQAGDGSNPAHDAAHAGHVQVLHSLHEFGVDLSVQDGHGMTPAHIAAAGGHVQVLQSLHELGVDLSVQDGGGRTPAHLAALGHVQVLHSLHELGVDPSVPDRNGMTPALIAADKGHVQVLHSLHNLGVDLSMEDPDGMTLVHRAASKGYVEVLHALHNVGVDLLVQDGDGMTPAHLAADRGHVQVLHSLHKLGVDLSVQDGDGMTPAHSAAALGHVQVLHSLHELGVDLLVQDGDGQTPADIAAAEGHVQVLHSLHKLGVDLSVQDGDGTTPAHLAADRGHVQVLHSLHKLGVDLSVQDGDGMTPAHIAAAEGHVQVLHSLHKLGVDLSVQDGDGRTPAHIAAAEGHVQVLHSLRALGVDLSVRDGDGWTPAQRAAAVGRFDVLHFLQESGGQS
eukprot:s1454_g3.t1